MIAAHTPSAEPRGYAALGSGGGAAVDDEDDDDMVLLLLLLQYNQVVSPH